MIGLEHVLPILCGLVAGLGREIGAQCAGAAGDSGRADAGTAARTSARRTSGDKTPMASHIWSDHAKHEMEYLGQNPRTKPSAALLTFAAIAIAGLMGTVATPASAAKDDYMFCEAPDREEKITYFSAIFLWDYSLEARAKLDFHSYLKDAGKNPNFLYTVTSVPTII